MRKIRKSWWPSSDEPHHIGLEWRGKGMIKSDACRNLQAPLYIVFGGMFDITYYLLMLMSLLLLSFTQFVVSASKLIGFKIGRP